VEKIESLSLIQVPRHHYHSVEQSRGVRLKLADRAVILDTGGVVL